MVMDFIDNAIKTVFCLHGRLFPFERFIISCVAEKLSDDARLKLISQMEQSNHFYRDPNGKSVLLYRWNGLKGLAKYDEDSLFNIKRPSFKLSKVKIRSPGKSTSITAELWITAGCLFEINYSVSPQKYFGVSNLNSVTCDIEDIVILNDPTNNPFETAKKQPLKQSCQKDVDALLGIEGSSDFQAPYSADFIAKVIKDYSSFLPETYVELMAQTNGCRVADVQFYGVEDINSVVLENAAFLSFAEIEGHGMFATQDGSRSREIWFLDYINHEEEKLGKSLSQALIAKMT